MVQRTYVFLLLARPVLCVLIRCSLSGWTEKETILAESYVTPTDKHLPFKLPGKPLERSVELTCQLKYLLTLVSTALLLWFLLPLVASWGGFSYSLLVSLGWHYAATKHGIDRLLVKYT